MATVNRYTQLPVAQYNPMSMQELAFAPTFLRQRHDATAEALANLEQASGQYDVLDPYRIVANQAVDPLQKGITNIAEQLATQGVNRSNAVAEAMKLKSQYTNLFGQAGAIGQLQNATKQYRAQAEAIQKQFENNPELARAALARLKPGEATYQDGKLTLGQMQSPTLYRHIADEEIMKQLNTAVAALKPSDFIDMGITGVQSAGSFNDLITAASQQRVSPERILGVMQANLGPEAMNSILQYADLVQGIGRDQTVDLKDKEGNVIQTIPAGFANFYNRMTTAANNLAYTDTDIQRYLRKDDLAYENYKDSLSGLSYEYDPYTQVVTPDIFDESYFTDNYQSPGADSPYTKATFGNLPQSAGITDKRPKTGYRSFSKEQEPIIKAILSEKLNIPADRITGYDLNKKENRKIIEEYYKKNKDNLRIVPKVENTKYLREYGGNPEKASKDLMDNYLSKQFIDSETRQVLSSEEIGDLLSSGAKINVVGVYGTGSLFTEDAKKQGIDSKAMTRPITANIVDENGKILKRVAVSRPASYFNSFEALEDNQTEDVFATSALTPNVSRTVPFLVTRNQKNQPIEPQSLNIKIKYKPESGTYEVQSINDEFDSFATSDLTNLSLQIANNSK